VCPLSTVSGFNGKKTKKQSIVLHRKLGWGPAITLSLSTSKLHASEVAEWKDFGHEQDNFVNCTRARKDLLACFILVPRMQASVPLMCRCERIPVDRYGAVDRTYGHRRINSDFRLFVVACVSINKQSGSD